MSNILVSVTPAPGHVNPLLLIAEHLSKQGHEVTFNTAEIFREKAEAAGLNFAPLGGTANFDYRLKEEFFPDRHTTEPGLPQFNYDMERVLGAQIPDQYENMQRLIQEQEIDLVLTDIGFFGSFPMILGAKARPPVVSCGILPYLMSRPEVSPFTGPDSTPEGLLRNLEHNRQLEEGLAGATASINRILRGYGISASIGVPFDAASILPDVFLEFTAEEFEYPIKDKPKNLQFVGPLVPKIAEKSEEPEWLKRIDGSKPVIFVTQGTIANYDFGQLVGPTIVALAEEDVEVIVTGGGVDVSGLQIPSNVHVERYLPYHLVLPKADLFITNGGYNGVQQALSFGVPVIGAGATEDKPFVCARVAWSGTGIDLKTGSPTSEQIKDAVRLILSDPKYRERAKKMAEDFARYDALSAVVQVAESVIESSAWRKAEKS
ncbi:glycosyltransferase [Terriglobus saanensis]|uniref:Glycosyltransferase, MGT family n=1 Tax=Terriglobus saanensis (strain ATCC BAA-1853 / DSM 23119 / SP1PR4) TaxID=401053 RepID=E8UXJ4_TERSS|nr:nucleotide disphospho-sugar-binding domain-containing protein [Terriglobus saanensis]ADV81938.1 glycosyltransferase, MGT family [Terriglobus saanensis SP1PR4]